MRAIFVLLLVVGACSKAAKYPEETPPQKETVVVPQKAKTYQGKIFNITNANQSYILIKGADAQKIFESLQLEPFRLVAQGAFGEGQRKNGQNIVCEQTSTADKPEEKNYCCRMSLSPKTGFFEGNPNAWSREEKSESPVSAQKGDYVDITPETFSVILRGKDARALFENLDFVMMESTNEAGDQVFTKSGLFVECAETVSKEEKHQYRCSVTFSLFTGAPQTK